MRILIADDHPLFRVGLRYALQAQGFTVVAEATDGQEAIAAYLEHQPDVTLLDVKMPKLDGIEACQRITAAHPKALIIILTTFDEPAIIQAARRAGATGYLSKELDPDELAATIRKIADDPQHAWLPRVKLPELTQREAQVLHLLQQGYSNKAMAKVLGISPETIKDYLNGVYRKLEVKDRLSAAQRAHELGLSTPE